MREAVLISLDFTRSCAANSGGFEEEVTFAWIWSFHAWQAFSQRVVRRVLPDERQALVLVETTAGARRGEWTRRSCRTERHTRLGRARCRCRGQGCSGFGTVYIRLNTVLQVFLLRPPQDEGMRRSR